MTTTTTVCESCMDAVYEYADDDLDWDDCALFAILTGADIADHFCDAREDPGYGSCACGCNLR